MFFSLNYQFIFSIIPGFMLLLTKIKKLLKNSQNYLEKWNKIGYNKLHKNILEVFYYG